MLTFITYRMKYIILFLVTILVSCQNQTENQDLLKEQNYFAHTEYEMIINTLMTRSEVNPQKYNHIKDQVLFLDVKHRELLSEFNGKKNFNKNLDSLMIDYFSAIESLYLGIEARTIILGYKERLIKEIDFRGNLSKTKCLLLQLSIRTVNSFAVRTIIDQPSKDSFKFNKMRAITIAEKSTVSKGDIYSAIVVLNAIDTTKVPIIRVNGSYIPIDPSGAGVVKIKANKTGIHYWNGEVYYTDENTGEMLIFPFQSSFEVE